MRKLMKVLALATVICMLMSVSAFAASDAVANQDKTVKITIDTGATTNEEVAVLIVESGVTPAEATDEQIMYIGQKTTTSGVVAPFDVTLRSTTKNVDVYLGSAKLAAATKIATIELAVVADYITIVTNKWKNYDSETLDTDVEGGTGIVMGLTYKVSNAINRMIFAFKPVGSTEKVYSSPVNVADKFDALEETSAVEFAVAFSNGNETLDMVEIEDIDLIVETVDAQGNRVSTIYTDADDAKKNADYVASQE